MKTKTKLTRQDKISYLIDVKCYTEEDAIEFVDSLDEEQLKECEEYTFGGQFLK